MKHLAFGRKIKIPAGELGDRLGARSIFTSCGRTTRLVRPQLVKMDLAPKTVPEFSSRYLNFTSKRGVSWYAYTQKISATGVMGDPTKASVEKGKKIWQIMIAHLVALVEDIKSMTLEEIHHRKY